MYKQLKGLLKTLLKRVALKSGYDIINIRKYSFTISGIRYTVGDDPCVVGIKDPSQSVMIAQSAIDMIRQRGINRLKILDMCCGYGIIGLTILSELRKEGIVQQVAFADINIFNINALLKIIHSNELSILLNDNSIRCYLSDGLAHIDSNEKFDIIISNPPHYSKQSFSKDSEVLSPSALGTYDPDWNFHKAFYSVCHNYLTDHGETWLLENSAACEENNFVSFIKKNNQLKYIGNGGRKMQDHRFFWMISMKN